ncbi:YCII-related domain protein [Sinomonas atrocyanea]|uniref:YCII-related domain protein n=1 Tax=Sinomonas atrocyanea TaxID=37927 RepID=A0A127A451_9MICC|nr:YciI family protein [Sinomonas atrocyanea]AMM34240.1 YCII-related domain protein [Sinomonas atrocyanea]GEB64731.1 hypothetical protein SAT01_21790 [Sinomonas atrocyanea]GGG66573.1 hypothetical protein GCM10007172_17760 [Sinomonas atrocyanea]
MLIVSLTYRVPMDVVEAHLEAHRSWLRDAVDRGLVVAAGRKNPRTGGILLSLAERGALEAAIAEDPFSVHGVADFEVTEADMTTAAAGFEALLT